MKLKTIAAAMLFGCLCAGAVYAAGEVEKREGMMKQIGGSMGALAAISKGQKPYDAEAVKAAVTTISTNAKAFPDQFPRAARPAVLRHPRSGKISMTSSPRPPSSVPMRTRSSPAFPPIRQASPPPCRPSVPIVVRATRPTV